MIIVHDFIGKEYLQKIKTLGLASCLQCPRAENSMKWDWIQKDFAYSKKFLEHFC